jgi:5'-nucleotidase
MRSENRNGEGECYQINGRVKAVYDDKKRELVSLKIDGAEATIDRLYSVCLQGYHFKNSVANLNLSQEQLSQACNPKLVSTSAQDVLVEYIRNNQNIKKQVEGRIIYLQ